MTTQVKLPGKEQSPEAKQNTAAELRSLLNVKVLAASKFDPRTRGEGEAKTDPVGAEDRDVVEIEYEDGSVRWMTVEQIRQLPNQRGRGANPDGSDAVEVPSSLIKPGTTRGGLFEGLTAKFINLFQPEDAELENIAKNKAPDVAAKLIAAVLEGRIEQQINKGGEGLYHFDSPKWIDGILAEKDLVGAGDLDLKSPYLIFIHGTASSSLGGFGKLGVRHGFDVLGIDVSPEWEALQKQYPERVLAFEHRTLSRSPIENAFNLASTLPNGARLHLVSHSRGGLVGELLCLSQVKEIAQTRDFINRVLKPFSESERKEDRRHLTQLVELLAEKRLVIERFVRVACPARGTKLASQGINDFFTGIFNLMKYLPWMKASPTLDFLRSTVISLLKYPTDPNKLPGIEAMMPTSPLIKMLNGLDLTTASDLAAIEGDIQPGAFFDRVKLLPVEALFRENNDLVVNTRAMSGGMKRENGGVKYFDQGQEVTHFSYFANLKTRLKLVNWLSSDAAAADRLSKTGFESLDATDDAEPISRGTRSVQPADLPVVFVLPDLMGSHLNAERKRVWVRLSSLAKGDFNQLRIDAPAVVADSLIETAYRDLIAYLKDAYEVIPFAYDWRRSLKDASERLAEAVDGELDQHNRPIRFLAHGSGGLAVRLMIAKFPELWEKLKKRDSRLLMLGTPNKGTYFINQLFAGQSALHDLTRLLDLENQEVKNNERLGILRAYPGLVELLPSPYLDDAGWQGSDHLKPSANELLNNAKIVRGDLEKVIDPDRLVYVAGDAPLTPGGMSTNGGGVAFLGVKSGDGRVTYEHGLLDRVRAWKAGAAHGDLASYKAAFPAYVELLEKGLTEKLPRLIPAAQEPPAAATPIVEEPPQMYPDEADLIAAALGKSFAMPEEPESQAIAISVFHGDLREAQFPVVVGHYKGFPIVGAERVIDKALNYRLSQLLQADLYPDEIGRAEVILNGEGKPKGALVIGLGEYGNANLQEIRRGLTAAALRHALIVLNDPKAKNEKGWASASFSALLLGSYSSSKMGVSDSVTAIIQGAIQANRLLRAQGLWEKVRIEEVEFIELYEDVALQAIRAAARFADRPPADVAKEEIPVLSPAYLKSDRTGQPQRPSDQYDAGWVRQVRVVVDNPQNDTIKDVSTMEDSERRLLFTIATERASSPEEVVSTQRKLVDGLIRKAIGSREYNRVIGTTLFELLVPNSFKDQISSEGDLLLEVDAASAQYPWELMAQRKRDDVKPIIAERGLIRRLATRQARPHPRMTQGNDVLIIGDPDLTGSTSFQRLKGAEAEARLVCELLKSQYPNPVDLIGANPQTIVTEMFQKDYRIIHLAGHGYYNPKNPIQSGMALADGQFLTAAEIQKLRVVPDLVFINCCYLGIVDQKPEVNKLAASISLQLINMGVKAVVAAGWEVDDQAAKIFAETFYKRMLGQARFIDAVREARNQVYAVDPGSNTWGAYQCYGDPEFRLSRPFDGAAAAASEARYYSAREYRDEFSRISVRAGKSVGEARKQLLSQFESLLNSIPPHMLTAEMNAILGDVCGEMGEFHQSFDYYDRARSAETPSITLKQLQQYANFLGRYARTLYQASKASEQTTPMDGTQDRTPKPSDFLDREKNILDQVLNLGCETSELLTLIGSHHKRRAEILDKADFIEDLKQAADAYHRAYRIKQKTKADADDFYGATNWLTCEALLVQLDPKLAADSDQRMSEIREQLKTLSEKAEPLAKASDDPWKRVYKPDLLTLESLIDRSFEEAQLMKLIKAYEFALNEESSRRVAGSVAGQFDFLIGVLNKAAKDQDNSVEFLKGVRASLSKFL